MATPFRVLQVARAVDDEVNSLLRDRRLRMIHRAQLCDSAESVPSNIREGWGRKKGPDRNVFYGYARSSAEETDEHLRSNFADERIPKVVFWRLHNRLMLVIKMLDSLMS
jgi:four helix bundle protein